MARRHFLFKKGNKVPRKKSKSPSSSEANHLISIDLEKKLRQISDLLFKTLHQEHSNKPLLRASEPKSSRQSMEYQIMILLYKQSSFRSLTHLRRRWNHSSTDSLVLILQAVMRTSKWASWMTVDQFVLLITYHETNKVETMSG